MKIKLTDEPVFLAAVLVLFFPAGLILLIRADRPRLQKALLGVCGGVVFFLFLSLGIFLNPKPFGNEEPRLIVTRETLSVGQSGGFALISETQLEGNFRCSVSNACLQLNDSVYTAVSAGECVLTVEHCGKFHNKTIVIEKGPGTAATVLSSLSSERYHKESAHHAGKYAIRMSEEDALRSGKTPCKICYK